MPSELAVAAEPAAPEEPAAASPELSPARARLRSIRDQIAEAQLDLRVAEQPVDRLTQIVATMRGAEAGEIGALVAKLRTEYHAALDEWLSAGAVGERPAPADDLVRAERQLVAVRAQAEEAAAQLPAVTATADQIRAQLQRLAGQQHAAVLEIAEEEALRAARHSRAFRLRALQYEGQARAIAAELFRLNENGRNPGAAHIAERINTAADAAKRGIEVAVPFDGARQFFNRLLSDPAYEWE